MMVMHWAPLQYIVYSTEADIAMRNRKSSGHFKEPCESFAFLSASLLALLHLLVLALQ